MRARNAQLEGTLLSLELLRRIPRQRKITAKELQAQLADSGFARDLRSIQRQLEILTGAFAIERDERSKPYGYRWTSESRGLSIPGLTPQESLLLSLAEGQLRHLLPGRLRKLMQPFFRQARTNLRRDDRDLEGQWQHKVCVVPTTQPLIPPKIDPEVFDTVSEALYENRRLALSYRNAAGKEHEAEVLPLGLAQQGERLYLVCQFWDYEDYRNLALHRIQRAQMLGATFTQPPDFDLSKYAAEGGFGFGTGERIRLMFCLDEEIAQHLLESRLSEDQEATQDPDGYWRFTATVYDSAMLDWWLRSFGDGVWDVQKIPIEASSWA